MSDVIERYEANAAAFFKDTGVMAPGKDVSAAMGEYDADELRHKLWKMWARAVYAEREREAFRTELARAREDAAVLREGIKAVSELIDDSHGVYGLHLNGDPSPWDELLTGGRYEEWLLAFDAARAAGGEGE